MTTGMLVFLLLTSAALTAPVSLILLWLYRRSVIRAMAGRTVAGAPPVEVHVAAHALPAVELRVEAAAAAPLGARDTASYRQVRDSLRIVIGIYVAAGLAYAAVMTGAWMVFMREDGFPLTRFFVLLLTYAWPVVIAVCIIAAVSARQRAAVAGVYLGVYAAVAIWSLARNPDLTVGQVALFWLIINGPSTVLLLAFLHRRMRAVGPMVLAFMVVAVTGAQVFVSLLDKSERALRVAVNVGEAFQLDGYGTFFAIILFGFAAFGVGG